jgi:hypothetical protein
MGVSIVKRGWGLQSRFLGDRGAGEPDSPRAIHMENKKGLEFDDILVFSPVDPDPIRLDDDGKVVVVIKTLDGDIAI